jgi:betaine-homocysteine S-methyltransferase
MGSGSERGLAERLEEGAVVCAEGYLFELERRGYLQAGAFVPEVVLEHPELVERHHRDLVHAGSDVVEALTYYAHREKLRVIGKEALLEPMNREALAIAARVARETGTLLAGDLSNTNVFLGDERSAREVRAMFEEQVGWAVDAGVDYVVAETISWGGEALIALDAIKAAGLAAVVTLAIHREARTFEGWTVAEAAARLEQAGADVVGLNCIRGPWTMLPLLREIRAAVSCHVAALPVPYRTTEAEPSFSGLADPTCPGARAFPAGLDPFTCTRYEVADFARQAHELGVRYLGLCCGAGPHHVRSLAEAIGRTPPASRYTEDMSRHAFFGSGGSASDAYRSLAERL